MSNDVFDREGALEFVGGDEELFHIVVDQFREDCPMLLSELHAALTAADAATVQRVAHTLKGLAATFAASRAMTAAKTLEQMGKEGRVAEAMDAFPGLQAELDRLLPVLS